MKRLKLKRVVNQADVTLGVLKAGKFIFHTLELPWKDNARNISCIPDGIYECKLGYSNKWKTQVYQIDNVEGRDAIQIHIGNITNDIRGCILLGMRFGTIQSKFAVLSSTAANKLFKKELDYQPFQLEIITC